MKLQIIRRSHYFNALVWVKNTDLVWDEGKGLIGGHSEPEALRSEFLALITAAMLRGEL